MPDNLPSMIMFGLFVLLNVICLIRVIAKNWVPAKTVKAKVVDKGEEKVFSRAGAYGKSVRYYVVFLAEGKKLSFYVNEFSYGGYHKGEKGKLTYKGSRLISFQ